MEVKITEAIVPRLAVSIKAAAAAAGIGETLYREQMKPMGPLPAPVRIGRRAVVLVDELSTALRSLPRVT